MKMVDENGGDTGMIRFGFGIAQRQGRCAYFTCLTFRSRLQELEYKRLAGFTKVVPKKNSHHALRKLNYSRRGRMERYLAFFGYTVTVSEPCV